MRHIRKPVTFPPDKAEKLYVAAGAVEELNGLIYGSGGSCNDATLPVNLLRIVGDQLLEAISEVPFQFED
jgi:hypothetical protein